MTASLASQGRWQIHVLFAIQLVSMGAMEMSGPFWPVHLKSLSSSDWLFGFAGIAVYVGPMLGIMLTSSFWGRLGDRTGHKLMMIRALAGLAVTQMALAYSNDVWMILVLRFLQGACAGYIAPAQAYGVSIEDPSRRARLFAYLQVSTNLGSMVGAILGGVILDIATFFWINFTASILCALSAVAVWIILPDVQPTTASSASAKPSSQRQPGVWRQPPVLGLLVVMGALLVSRLIPQTPFSLYVSGIFNVDNWIVGLCYGLQAFGFVVSASLWAKYFEGRTLQSVLGRMALVAGVCILLMVIAGLTRSANVFIGIYFLWGILLGATTPVLMSQISNAAGNLRQGHILGIAQSTIQFSSIAGIALGGWFSQAVGLEYTYFLVAAVYAVALAGALAVRFRNGASANSALNEPATESSH
ncbi:MFS transporter [Aestuariispira ectoiniformans]|uniref:MFS transporter n=1 Tax=Aestuariispira ectoiniformans TaxID=2775080 RepID=UPI00223ABEF8|nr:MFS transporter [Aestuariispira ectoiniformans]